MEPKATSLMRDIAVNTQRAERLVISERYTSLGGTEEREKEDESSIQREVEIDIIAMRVYEREKNNNRYMRHDMTKLIECS